MAPKKAFTPRRRKLTCPLCPPLWIAAAAGLGLVLGAGRDALLR